VEGVEGDRGAAPTARREPPSRSLDATLRVTQETHGNLRRFLPTSRGCLIEIDRVTPSDLSPEKRSEELGLFIIISGLDVDDPLRRQLISQKDVALGDAYSSFLDTDRGEAIKAEAIESANAAFGNGRFLCRSSDHFAKECPHRDTISSPVARRNTGGDGKCKKGKGQVIYSRGLGSIRFLSKCGYYVTIHDILFVPLLTVNLFASNRFARDHHNTHLEMAEYPERRWINCRTGAIESTTTLQRSNLVHLDWAVTPRFESANLLITELHT
jgi:hypothetical protein